MGAPTLKKKKELHYRKGSTNESMNCRYCNHYVKSVNRCKIIGLLGGRSFDVRRDYRCDACGCASQITAKDNQIVQAGLIIDAMDMIISNGEEPSDFEMSFPLVRAVWDRHEKCMAHEAEITALKERVRELEEWVNDLHSGMYINCVYCGHRYGPKKDTPSIMADVLKRHIEKCPKHPLSHAMSKIEALELRNRELVAELAEDRCRQDGEDEELENVHPLFQDILKPFLRGRKQ